MKKNICRYVAVMFVLIHILALSACSSEGDKNNSSDINGLFTMVAEYTEYRVSDTIKLTIYNNTTDEVVFDGSYVLYRFDDGAYKSVHRDGLYVELEKAYVIEAKSSSPCSITLQNIYGDLEPGIYLIRKDLSAFDGPDETMHSVYCLIEIVDK